MGAGYPPQGVRSTVLGQSKASGTSQSTVSRESWAPDAQDGMQNPWWLPAVAMPARSWVSPPMDTRRPRTTSQARGARICSYACPLGEPTFGRGSPFSCRNRPSSPTSLTGRTCAANRCQFYVSRRVTRRPAPASTHRFRLCSGTPSSPWLRAGDRRRSGRCRVPGRPVVIGDASGGRRQAR